MDCPKCHAGNSDEAAVCSLCFHVFKPKASAPAKAPSEPAAFKSAPVPGAEATVKCYGLVELTKTQYIALQALALVFVVSGLLAAYGTSDAAFRTMLPPEILKDMPLAQLRGGLKAFFWIGLVYESAEAWYFLGKFREKEEALARAR